MFNKVLKQLILLAILTVGCVQQAFAFEINSIEIEGNKRISYETIYSYLPIDKGEQLDKESVQKGIQALYRTGFFKDVSFWQRTPSVLVIKVAERPSISEIKIEGNELIDSDDMTQALEGLGVKKGRIFNSNQMDKIIVDLRRRYQNQGYYAADVDIEVEDLPRNRVSVLIKVEEGKPASIGRITLVGNKTFTDATLKTEMLLSESSIGDGDQYAKPKLLADQETLRSYYMDRGFAEFKHQSSQVSLSLDRTRVFVTLNMQEGDQFTIDKIAFSGETIIKDQELKDLLQIQQNELFNRSAIVKTVNALRDRLSEEGYAFAEVEPLTTLNKDKKLVSLNFRVEPKDRVYVRKIIVEGNTRTRDHVIRRELRQLEAAPYSLQSIKRSNTRLNRLGFFKFAKVETKRISKDQVDLVVKVEEQSTGSFNAGIGYSQTDGSSITLGVTERNVLGSGNSLSLNAQTSASTKKIDLSLTNPYFTQDGVSLGGGFYLREINADELGVSDYTINNYGFRTTLSYPVSEFSRLSYGVKLDTQSLLCNSGFNACKDYTNAYGEDYTSAKVSFGWVYDSKDAFYFPTKGVKTSINTEVSVPLDNSEISFYKVYLDQAFYTPVSEAFTLKLDVGLAYGDGYGSYQGIPFFENFYTGGIGSVRGYEPNSLGPRYDSTQDGSSEPKGGRVKVNTTAALVFPMPFIDDSSNLRLSLFIDAGNVFEDLESVDSNELRLGSGLGLSWLTPMGPLSFSLARALNDKEGDEVQTFQFSLGVPM